MRIQMCLIGCVLFSLMNVESVLSAPGGLGACCLPDLSCEFLTEFECGQVGGSFQGEFTTCAKVTCVAFEACCFTGGSCSMETPDACLALGGTPQGPGSTCATSDCSNNSCGLATPIALGDTPFTTIGATTDGPGLPECTAAFPFFKNDIWFTYLPQSSGTLSVSTCNQADFDTKIAAYAGGCAVLSLIACAEDTIGCDVNTSAMELPVTQGVEVLLRVGAFSSLVFGSGTLTLALVPNGACCFTDGTCVELEELACTDQGGEYQGDGTDCLSINCPLLTGACCFPNGSCTVLTEAVCTTIGGSYQGDDTDCISVACPQPLCGFLNPSFETGDFTGWIVQDLNTPFFPMLVDPSTGINLGFTWGSAATDGFFTAFHGFAGDGASSGVPIKLAQDVIISNPLLTFDWRAAWDLPVLHPLRNAIVDRGADRTFDVVIRPAGGVADRTFDVVIRPAGGGAELDRFNILTTPAGTFNFDTGPQSSEVDLSAFLGQTVRVCFEWLVPDDFSGPAQFQFDNVCSVPTCPADFDLNDVVDVEDLLFLLASWGGPGADTDDNGTTDVEDLLDLLAAWGGCP